MERKLQKMSRRIYEKRQNANYQECDGQEEELRKAILKCEKMILDIFKISHRKLDGLWWICLINSINIEYCPINRNLNNLKRIRVRVKSESFVSYELQIPKKIISLMDRIERILEKNPKDMLKQISEDFSTNIFFDTIYQVISYKGIREDEISLTIRMK